MNLQEQFEKETYMRPAEPYNDIENPEQWARVAEWQDEYIKWLEERCTKWVDVNDMLPDKFIRVLVTDRREVTQAYIGHVRDEFQGQFLLNDEHIDKPTHWAELPGPFND